MGVRRTGLTAEREVWRKRRTEEGRGKLDREALGCLRNVDDGRGSHVTEFAARGLTVLPMVCAVAAVVGG